MHTHAPTLADVAAASGVAVSTVSRALAKPDRVNAVTRERVVAAARELGYVPNAQARALSSGRTGAIAVVVADVTNPFYFDIIKGTGRQLRAAGYTQLLIDSEESSQPEDATLRRLASSFDGAVIAASRLSDRDLIALAEDVPLVTLNRQTRGVAGVFIDTPSGIAQAVDHLVSFGHRSIAYIAGPDTSWSNARRFRAFGRAARSAGVSAHRIPASSPRMDAGAAAADALMNTGATACIAFNDLLAIGVLERLADRGVSVPAEVSVVGCDDIFGSTFCNPPLTTLTAPIEQAGRTAVSMLLSRLETMAQPASPASSERITLPTHLTVRLSTGPAPSNGQR